MATRDEWEKLFSQADVNNDGKLTVTEICDVMRKNGYPGDDAKIKKFFFDIDTTGDRRVTKEEFMHAMENAPDEIHVAALVRTVFGHFDKSGDGEISAAELQQAMAELGSVLPGAQVAQIMAKVDKDGSGTINVQEFIDAIVEGKL